MFLICHCVLSVGKLILLLIWEFFGCHSKSFNKDVCFCAIKYCTIEYFVVRFRGNILYIDAFYHEYTIYYLN